MHHYMCIKPFNKNLWFRFTSQGQIFAGPPWPERQAQDMSSTHGSRSSHLVAPQLRSQWVHNIFPAVEAIHLDKTIASENAHAIKRWICWWIFWSDCLILIELYTCTTCLDALAHEHWHGWHWHHITCAMNRKLWVKLTTNSYIYIYIYR